MKQKNASAHAQQLQEYGFTVFPALDEGAVAECRRTILSRSDLLKNTRPNPSSGHLAGFHRYPALEPLHALVSANSAAIAILEEAAGSRSIRSIGLSDITINRSQEWHVDLLRGPYRSHLTPETCWGDHGGGVYKVLLYLQSGATLRVIAGAHNQPVSLDDDRKCEPKSADDATAVAVAPGNIVLMDIRLPHRGSSEEELLDERNRSYPKILISTVLAASKRPLANAMERGNLERLLDWDAKHGANPSPRFDFVENGGEAAVPA
jgi:hypothetical protein